MKIMKIIITLITSFLLLACPGDDFDPDIEITYVNNSDIDIIRLPLRFTGILPENTPFESQEFIEARVILARSEFDLEEESSNIDENGLSTVFLSREVVETVPWEEIREQNLVLKVFDLTLEELEALDYTLAYP